MANSNPATPAAPDDSATQPSSTATVLVGIDLGALTTKITLGPNHDHELVRNAHGGHTTPTAVTFSGKHRARLLGENAAEVTRADGNTVSMLDRLLVDSLDDNGKEVEDVISKFQRFEMRTSSESDARQNQNKVYIPNMDEEYSTTALAAMLVGNVRGNVMSTIARLEGNNTTAKADNLHFVFAVPPSYPQSTRNELMDAAYGANIINSSVVDSSACLAAVYERKFGDIAAEDEAAEAKEKTILVVEMGHARTSVSVLRMLPSISEATTTTTTTDESKSSNENDGGDKVRVLSTISSPSLGANLIDIALYHHFLSNHPSLSHHTLQSLQSNSRPAQRLLEGCRKLKHLLSMLPENTVTVENIGKNESDVNLSCTRETMKELCREVVIDRLEGMIDSALVKAGVAGKDGIDAVEITGGGLRIPFVQETIRNAIGKGEDEDFAFSRSLDDTSLAFGASLVGIAASSNVNDADDAETMDADRHARRTELLENETAMSRRDVELLRKDEFRNQIEAHVLELRSARHSKHGSLLPSSEEFSSYLDGVDDWLFSEECDEASCERMEEEWDAVRSKTRETCGKYFAATKAEAEEKDREMEREARAAAAEAAAASGGENDDEADHDTRRLPTKRRMEIVLKNKNEANELFSDGNYRHAAARYAKALTHCAKFFDLSPEEEREVRDTKLSLHLNMALCYIKLEKLDNAYLSCDEALKLDGKSVKALYRRATVRYQKRKFEDAVKDLKEAESLAPDDKAVKKLQVLVDKQMEKQKKKEKAMAKKMFG